MLNGNYVSIQTIIEYISRHYKGVIDPMEVTLVDVMEGAAELMGLIGAPTTFEEHTTTLTVSNYNVAIPSDLILLQSLRINDTDSYLRRATSKFNTGEDAYTYDAYTFKENNGYYYFNFEEGTVEISYLKYPTDTNGYPLIPDNETWKLALTHYIAHIIIRRLRMRGEVTSEALTLALQSKSFYTRRAENEAKMPDVHMLENIKAMFLRLTPHVYSYDSGFGSIGTRSRRPVKNTR